MTTFGLTAYQSIVNEHPIVGQLIPDSLVRNIDGARMLFEFAAQTERDALATANRVVAAHNAGLMTRSDYVNYDNFRHHTYETQVAWLRKVREQLYLIPGGYVYANRLVWPSWLQPVRPEMPRNLLPQQITTTPAAGTSGLGAAPLFVGVAGIVLLVVIGLLAAFVVDRFSEVGQSWMMLKAQGSALETSVEARRDAYNACVQAGTNAETCAQSVTNAIPAPSQDAIDHLLNQNPTGKGFVYYMGVAAIAVVVIGVGWYGWRQGWFGKAPSGTRGLGSPTRLRTLKDKNVPSRYGLEV